MMVRAKTKTITKKVASKLKKTVGSLRSKKTAKSKHSKKTVSSSATKRKLTQAELHDMIEKKAYELFEKRGQGHGRDWDDWHEAEAIVRKKYSTK